MDDSLSGAFHRGGSSIYPNGDLSAVDELESLRKENLLYAEKLSR